jgi:hypothetical protein
MEKKKKPESRRGVIRNQQVGWGEVRVEGSQNKDDWT